MAGARAGAGAGRQPEVRGATAGKSKSGCAAAGLRVTGDYRPEKIGSKIRDAQLELIPYMFVIGGREMDSGSVAVRDRIEGDLGSLPLDQAIAKLQAEVAERKVRQVAAPMQPAPAEPTGEANGH